MACMSCRAGVPICSITDAVAEASMLAMVMSSSLPGVTIADEER